MDNLYIFMHLNTVKPAYEGHIVALIFGSYMRTISVN